MSGSVSIETPVNAFRGFTFFCRKYWLEITTVILTASAIILGCIGFAKAPPQGQTQSWGDIFYLTIQLFVMQSGAIPGPVPWELELARFLAPLALAGAILKVFHEAIQGIVLQWFTQNHIVICGIGRKGLELIKSFHRGGSVVVAIDKNEQNDATRVCRDLGIQVLVGDASDKQLLKKARVYRAQHVVAMCPDDGVNVGIALHTLQLVKEKRVNPERKIGCYVHMVDLQLHHFLQRQSLFADCGDPLEVRVFNTYANCARQLWNNHPLDYQRISANDPRTVYLQVLGFGRMGQSVVLQSALVGHFANGKKLRVTVIDAGIDKPKKHFLGRHPQLDKVCDVVFVVADPEDPEALEQVHTAAKDPSCLTTVVICLENDSRCLSTAMNVLSRLGRSSVPILVQMTTEGGLAAMLQGRPNVHPFSMASLGCTRDLLLHEDLDRLARVAHECYRAAQRGHKPEDHPSMRPWESLAADLQDANRHQADHIPVKLRAVGCFSSAPGDQGSEVTAFSAEELELLARMEHARWNAERFLAGWTLGPKDDENRTHPYLVSWEELPEEIREYDREAVRHLFPMLESVNLRVYRSG